MQLLLFFLSFPFSTIFSSKQKEHNCKHTQDIANLHVNLKRILVFFWINDSRWDLALELKSSSAPDFQRASPAPGRVAARRAYPVRDAEMFWRWVKMGAV